jgi:hypothetical protein
VHENDGHGYGIFVYSLERCKLCRIGIDQVVAELIQLRGNVLTYYSWNREELL